MQAQQSRLMFTLVVPCRSAQAMQRPLCASMTAGQGRMHISAPPQSECWLLAPILPLFQIPLVPAQHALMSHSTELDSRALLFCGRPSVWLQGASRHLPPASENLLCLCWSGADSIHM